jgi:myo-inositol-1(or 4)-monophosphatase
MCYAAEGVFDGYWEDGLEVWDVAGASVIAEEAGATVTDTCGETFDACQGSVTVSNGRFHSDLVKLIRAKVETIRGSAQEV